MKDSKHTILLVSTSTEELHCFGRQLHSAGFNVLVAQSGMQAFGIAKFKKPNLILIFDNLTDISIFELIHEIQHLEIDGCPKILVTRYNSDPDSLTQFENKGIDKILNSQTLKHLILPALEEVLETEKKSRLDSDSSKHPAVQKTKILLVEDNELNQVYISALLDEMGIENDLAAHADQAFQKIQTTHYDLILTDLNLPGISGIDLVKKIRTEHSLQVPVIGITGHSDSLIKKECLFAGMNAVLVKPFSQLDLETQIKVFLPLQTNESTGFPSNASEALFNDDYQAYDYSKALEIAKGDDELFITWLKGFHEIVRKAKTTVEESIEKNYFPERNKEFHDLINYSGYYGLTELKTHIVELQSFEKELLTAEVQKIFYLNIKPEIKKILDFYTELIQNYPKQTKNQGVHILKKNR